MPIVLQKPGTLHTEEMPDLGLVVTWKTLDAQTGSEVQVKGSRFVQYLQGEYKDKNGEEKAFDIADYFETVIGYMAEKIEGLELEGQPFEIQKSPDGKLTHECLNAIFPVAAEIADFLVGKLNLKKNDVKNS